MRKHLGSLITTKCLLIVPMKPRHRRESREQFTVDREAVQCATLALTYLDRWETKFLHAMVDILRVPGMQHPISSGRVRQRPVSHRFLPRDPAARERRPPALAPFPDPLPSCPRLIRPSS